MSNLRIGEAGLKGTAGNRRVSNFEHPPTPLTTTPPTAPTFPMTLSKPDLWRRLEVFEIDRDAERGTANGKPVQLTFAGRLARENGWTIEFAKRVVEEYKRFVYLACVSRVPVTPSEDVDQAWHMHLAYTRNYWHELCDGILGRPLHHGPTSGGDEEDAKYHNLYEQTLALYEAEFGHAPDPALWPAPEKRFGTDLHWCRVNTARNWVVPKRLFATRLTGIAASLGMAAIFAGCSMIDGKDVPLPMVLLGVFVVVVILSLIFKSRGSGGSGCSTSSSGCGTFLWFNWGDSSSSSSSGDDGSGDSGGGDGGSDGGGGCSSGGCGGGGCGGGGD